MSVGYKPADITIDILPASAVFLGFSNFVKEHTRYLFSVFGKAVIEDDAGWDHVCNSASFLENVVVKYFDVIIVSASAS